MSLFSRYFRIREESEENSSNTVTSHVKLQKKQGNNEFLPFVIDKSNHANLAKIVKAFVNSDKVGLGYTTIEKNKGEVEPQLKKKSLYLTGGAVRDHLVGKTPKNYDLVTDATPSEIRMILKNAGFKEVKSQGDKPKNDKLPNTVESGKIFYASRWDKRGKEMEILAVVKSQPFRISTLSKSPKSKNFNPEDAKMASSIEEDASNRDLTINAMYIPLTKADGENSDLIDPFGGAHHLKSGELKVVGEKFGERMEEDPLTIFRMVNHFNRYGKGKFPEKYNNKIDSNEIFSSIDPKQMKDEFVKGLENPDVDAKKFLNTYHSTGLMGLMFPNIEFDPSEIPADLRSDRWMACAWVLRKNNPNDVKDLLIAGGWNKQEANDISYLVKFYQWGKNKFDSSEFYNMIKSHTGLTKSKIKEWMHVTSNYSHEVDNFMNFNGDDLNSHSIDAFGVQKINPIYIHALGREPVGNEFDSINKLLLTNRWQDTIKNNKC